MLSFCAFINVSQFTDLLYFIDSHDVMHFGDIYFCIFKDNEDYYFIYIFVHAHGIVSA